MDPAINYILRYIGEGKPNALKLRRELRSNNITIVDNSALPRMAMVALHIDDVARLRDVTGPDWDMFPETSYTIPTTRRKVKK